MDTNVISEVRKGERCDRNVAAWYASIAQGELYLSVLVTGEIRRGIEMARRRDAARAAVFEERLTTIEAGFADRLLAIDRACGGGEGRGRGLRRLLPVGAYFAA